MSTTATHPTLSPVGHDLRFTGVVRAEWIKFRSIRSTWWAYAILVVLTVGFGAQMSASLSFEGVEAVPTQDAVQDMAVYAVMVSTDVSALIVSVLGVLMIAGEYGTGMIRSTLTAVPKRVPALLAKALVFAVVTFVVSAVAFAITVPVSVGLFAGDGLDVALDDPQYWLALLGGVGYLVLVGLIAFGIGALLRNTAGGIAVALGLVLAAPLVLALVLGFASSGWVENLAMLLPSTAGSILFKYPTEQSWVDLLAPESAGWLTEPWQGGLVLVGWAVVLFAAAAVLLKRRDV